MRSPELRAARREGSHRRDRASAGAWRQNRKAMLDDRGVGRWWIALPFVGFLSIASTFEGTLRAEDQTAPVPPPPDEGNTTPGDTSAAGSPKTKKKRRSRGAEIAPGFEDSSAAESSPDDAGPTPEDPRGGAPREDEEEDDELRAPVHVPPKGTNERLIEEINAATGEVSLSELVDEILADVVAEIDARPKKTLSPMAIRQIALGANVAPSYGRKLESAIIAQLHAGTDVRVVQCIECEATTTRLVGDQWVITRGVVSTDEMKRAAERLGVKSFMDVSFGFDPETGVLEMEFRVIRAKDAYVIWSDSFRADETTPLIARSSEGPMRRKDRLRDLEMLLEGRPFYGYVATAGFMILPHNDPVDGDITGATAGYRIYERFGIDRRVMFGLDLTGFLNTSRLAGAVIAAGSWWIPLRPDLINPELRLGAKAGAFIAGSAGNAAVFQLGAEILLRYRFGLYGYVLFMTKSEFPPDSSTELGGVGMSTGMSFNW